MVRLRVLSRVMMLHLLWQDCPLLQFLILSLHFPGLGCLLPIHLPHSFVPVARIVFIDIINFWNIEVLLLVLFHLIGSISQVTVTVYGRIVTCFI